MSGSHHNESHTSEKTTVAAWSLLASFLLAAAKFVAAFVSGSLGLLSEAFHSTMDFVATAVTFFAIRYAERPADEDHPFGHAKMESVAALIETAMLFGVTGWIVYEALIRLTKGGHEVEISWWIIAVVVGSIIIDFNRSRALQTTADKTQSDALAADALHFRADMWSSCAVLVGLGLSYAGYAWADPAAALVVAVFVAHAAYGLGRRTLATLLDAVPDDIVSAHFLAVAYLFVLHIPANAQFLRHPALRPSIAHRRSRDVRCSAVGGRCRSVFSSSSSSRPRWTGCALTCMRRSCGFSVTAGHWGSTPLCVVS